MIKPVKCGCGGKAIIYINGARQAKIYCEKCGIESNVFATKYEAITAWNRAMGERTAKVKLQDICWEDIRRYKEGMCASCGRSVYDHAKYCDECGCRLEWDE